MDDDDLFICDECDEVFDNIFDLLVHTGVDVSVPIKITDGIALDLWTILQEVYYMVDDGEYEKVKQILVSVAATLYASSKGVLRQDLEDALVRSFVDNLDDTLKELLDE
jgi:hypothetical protein